MSLRSVQQLINSMSGAEKRYFKQRAGSGHAERDYLQMFELLCEEGKPDAELWKKVEEVFDPMALDSVSRYLMEQLTDCLIRLKINKDPVFQLYQGIMQVKVLQERSLQAESDKKLAKLRQKASELEQPSIQYIAYRLQLDRWNASGFARISDQELVEQQMKARELLKGMNYIQDHYSLFEMMKYRLLQGGQILAESDKKKLNDLMLSELVLMAGKHQNNFTTQKLHLLFQSYFLTTIGDFESAISTYYALNKVFEDHLHLLDHPPLDYLAALDGILNSLRRVGKWHDMDYYLGKLTQLDQAIYPEYFRFQVRKSIAIYTLNKQVAEGDFTGSLELISQLDRDVISSYYRLNEEKQWELYFFISVVYYRSGLLKKAHGYLAAALQRHTLQANWLVCKAARLLDMIIYYEQGDTAYLEYEIRSYNRFFKKEKRTLLKSEELVLRLFQYKPSIMRKAIPQVQANKLRRLLEDIQADKYEQQLLAYFDFREWVTLQVSDRC
ncbi:hypothetical protein [Flavihumibacter sp. CACIAM 22H1]|uniref:hypothetical protein n=1 Tax=Flavihumibacter sp. CACIAM 22H1 TaxID=1812911 RepID=UPI000AC049AB|nr:hypothetical protein [Flavihumibacter sp. CACIAM 22H1]